VETAIYEGRRASSPSQPDRSTNPAPPSARPSSGPVWPGRLVVAGLLLLGLFPLVFGALRLVQFAGGPALMPPNTRVAPAALVVHIVGAFAFAVLGPFQFSDGLRRRHRGWHQVAGRVGVLGGLMAAFSGLWMTLAYAPQPGTGALLFVLRLVFGSAMVASMVLGVDAARRGDINRHRAWITRGYAIGLGAATQMLTLMIGEAVAGPVDELGNGLLNGAGWVINLAVAEWAIRTRIRRSVGRAPQVARPPTGRTGRDGLEPLPSRCLSDPPHRQDGDGSDDGAGPGDGVQHAVAAVGSGQDGGRDRRRQRKR
jgi:uncharacterized membrane protein